MKLLNSISQNQGPERYNDTLVIVQFRPGPGREVIEEIKQKRKLNECAGQHHRNIVKVCSERGGRPQMIIRKPGKNTSEERVKDETKQRA